MRTETHESIGGAILFGHTLLFIVSLFFILPKIVQRICFFVAHLITNFLNTYSMNKGIQNLSQQSFTVAQPILSYKLNNYVAN